MVTPIEPVFEKYLRDKPRLSYSSPDHHWISRKVTEGLEFALGGDRLETIYSTLKAKDLKPQEFFAEALNATKIDWSCDTSALDLIPDGSPVVFVSNHPFGLIDGLILCNIAASVCGEFKILINALLFQDRDLAKHFLPVDFAQGPQARECNIATKRNALEALAQGIPVAIFPSGKVSTADLFGFGRVADAPWTTFVAKLIRQSRAMVVPVFFFGKNSRSFHIASHLAEPVRMGLLAREANRQFGKRVNLRIGKPIAAQEMANLGSRSELTHYLYNQVQDLARAS
jgi:putative hemolysin|tara:strand:+ start:260 stop:1114 length:855 start_codon:yes stop_codon:yes gene_type:complete